MKTLNLGDIVKINLPDRGMVGDYVVSVIFSSEVFKAENTVGKQYNFQKLGQPYKDDELEDYDVDKYLTSGEIVVLDSSDYAMYKVTYSYPAEKDRKYEDIAVIEKEKLATTDLYKYFEETIGDRFEDIFEEQEDGLFQIKRAIPIILGWEKYR